MWTRRYWPGRYFTPRYWPGGHGASAGTVTQIGAVSLQVEPGTTATQIGAVSGQDQHRTTITQIVAVPGQRVEAARVTQVFAVYLFRQVPPEVTDACILTGSHRADLPCLHGASVETLALRGSAAALSARGSSVEVFTLTGSEQATFDCLHAFNC